MSKVRQISNYYNHTHRDLVLLGLSWVLAVGILIFAGVFYRSQVRLLDRIVRKPILLEHPLKDYPLIVGDWVGKDVVIPEYVQRIAGNDDFINRLYTNRSTKQWANVYVAYTGRPRTMLGHRPEVCYVAGGWMHEGSDRAEFITSSGRVVPCFIHRFRRPDSAHQTVMVMNFYVLNGQLICSESGFSGVSWRTPNIAGPGISIASLARDWEFVSTASAF